ncbi:hypothetical protein MRX96_001285 [Rhipicephalus microplus]
MLDQAGTTECSPEAPCFHPPPQARRVRQPIPDDWEAYHPHTNVVWLHYLLVKLLEKLSKRKRATKVINQSTSHGRLMAWENAILALPSAEEYVIQHVLPHLDRVTEAPRKVRRVEQPPTRKPHGRKQCR